LIGLESEPRGMSEIHFIGGEKGGIGKSVLSRVLAQYWIDRQTPWRGFDGDLSHGALVRYYADFATPLDLERLEDLDTLLETAAAEPETRLLIDLAAQSERPLHAWLASADVPQLSQELGIRLVLWHIMDEGKDSVTLLERLIGRYGESVEYVVVLNQGRGESFELFEQADVRGHLRRLEIPVITLRDLHRATMRKIDRLDKSFWAAAHNEGPPGESLGLMERQRVKVWLRHAYDELERIGL
jgi:hypothetical protein